MLHCLLIPLGGFIFKIEKFLSILAECCLNEFPGLSLFPLVLIWVFLDRSLKTSGVLGY